MGVPADFETVLKHCDTNANGNLDFVEFIACTLTPTRINEKLCSEVFRVLDREYNGKIDAADLQLLCQSMKHTADEYTDIIREAEETIREAGCLKGYLDLNDFHRFIRG